MDQHPTISFVINIPHDIGHTDTRYAPDILVLVVAETGDRTESIMTARDRMELINQSINESMVKMYLIEMQII